MSVLLQALKAILQGGPFQWGWITATVKPSIPVTREGERIGLILDTETTGLDHGSHEIIELGMVAFTYGEAGIRDVVGTV